MSEVMKMDTKLVLEYFSQLSEYQKESLSRIILDYMDQNSSTTRLFPEVCPTCGKHHARFIKAGFQNGTQRIKCKECGKTFVCTKGQLTYWSHQSVDIWNKVLLDTLNLATLAETAAEINVAVPNVFYMRHKILIFLEQLVHDDNQLLSGIIEFDETYVNDAYKGRFQSSIPTGRKARRHGGTASKRGLSKEKICILTASDRNGHEVIRAVCRAKPTTQSVLNTFTNKIRKQSICVNDGVFSYDRLISIYTLENRVVKDKSMYTPAYHLNTVNSIHSEWKRIWEGYKGVSTKYLNRYLSLMIFIRSFMGMDRQEQFQAIHSHLNKVMIITPIRIVKSLNVFTI